MALLAYEIAQVIPGIRPREIEEMPYVQVLQLRALAWHLRPGVRPVGLGPSWLDDELGAINS